MKIMLNNYLFADAAKPKACLSRSKGGLVITMLPYGLSVSSGGLGAVAVL